MTVAPQEVEARVLAILGSGPWTVEHDYAIQGYALWEILKKRGEPWRTEPWRKRPGPLQCTGCGAVFSGTTGFNKHRAGMRCHDPVELGLFRDARGVWREPAREPMRSPMGRAIGEQAIRVVGVGGSEAPGPL